MEKGVIAKGQILTETNEQRWIVGSFIGLNGSTESYEAASYNDDIPTDYPAILQIVPSGDKPLPNGFQFYLDHAKPDDLENWKRTKQIEHLGIPVLLGAGSLKINDQNYKFMVIELHRKDLWTLFLDHGKKFEAHTVYKITLHIMNALKYVHGNSYVHGDIKPSNVVVDEATQNQIYVLNEQLALHTVSNDHGDPDKTCNNAVVLLSRDAHTGDSTERGDMEMLFYNLVQWLGIELPWKKNFNDPSLVLKQKKDAFGDVDKFLENWSKETAIPIEVCEYMKLLATMDIDDSPKYSDFKRILTDGLWKLYHVPTGNLEFSISSVPIVEQTAEDSDQANELQKRHKKMTSIPYVRISVTKLAIIISENCRHEGEVRLRDIGSGSLMDNIFKLASRKKSEAIQNKIANAWDKNTAGLKTMTKKLWEEKALKAKRRTTKKATLTEMRHEKPDQNTPTVAAASMNASTSGLNHSNPVTITSPLEDLASLDLPNIFPPNVRQTLQDAPSASSSRSHVDQSPLFRTSSSGYSSPCSSRVDFHSEDLPLFRTPDPFHEKVPYQSSKNVATESEKETDSIDDTVTECWRSESVDGPEWPKTYEWLNAWLNMKQLALDAFGQIPSEPRRVSSQVQDVRVLLDDFHTRMPRIRQLAKVKLSPESADAQKLIQIQIRWQNQLDSLEKRGRELGETSLGQVREVLQDVANDLANLLDQNPEEQLLRKVEILAGRLEAQRTLLAGAGTVTEQLYQAFSDSTFTVELRTELQSVNELYGDLQHRINLKKTEIEKILGDGRHFDDSCKKIIVWLAKELDVSEKRTVSADPERLQQQKQQCQLVLDKEFEVIDILHKGYDCLLKTQNLEYISTQQSLLDLMKSQWDRLKNCSEEISSRLQSCIERYDKYYHGRNLFLDWLSKAEDEFRRLRPALLDDTETVLKELPTFENEVRGKSGDFEQVSSLGEAFIDACDEDNDVVVKNELVVMKNRWEKLNNEMRERIQFLEDTACRFAVFNKRLNKLDRRLDELQSHDALREEAQDPNLIDDIKGLRQEADSLRRPLEDLRQLAKELESKVAEQEIDAGRLLNEVDRVAAGIVSVKTKIVDKLNKLYEQKLHSIEKDVKPEINAGQEQDEKPRIPLPNTNQSYEKLVDLVNSSEDEADFAIEEKPRLLPSLTNSRLKLSEELIDLVSSSDSEDELCTPQRERSEAPARTHQNQFEEVLKNDEHGSKADDQEQQSKENLSQEKNDANSVSSKSLNGKSKSSKKKRKKPLRFSSDSDNSESSDYHENRSNKRESRKESDSDLNLSRDLGGNI